MNRPNRILAVLLAFAAAPASAQETPRQGIDYRVLDQQSCLAKGRQVEIVEIFSYTCIHCYRLEADLVEWKKQLPEKAAFRKMPVVWRDNETPLARLFWSLEIAGVGSHDVQRRIFSLIHDRRRAFATDEDVLELARRAGLDSNRIARVMKSFLVKTRVRQSKALTRSWQITGTPSFVVDGRYMVVANRKNNLSRPQMLEVVRWLTDRELENDNPGSCNSDDITAN